MSELNTPVPSEFQSRKEEDSYFNSSNGYHGGDAITPGLSSASATPGVTPGGGLMNRSDSISNTSAYRDEDELPPLDRLTVFDFLENLALPQRLERLQLSISTQRERVRRQQQKLKDQSKQARDRVVDEWRRRVPTPDERLKKYRKRMSESVDRLGKRWSDSKAVTMREKISFIFGVLNIFMSGYVIGAFPEWFHIWYTAQLGFFYPIRFYTYHRRGYHYFLADLCYFVNILLLLSIWAFPASKRLFISTFCLAFGNNAVAIVMWRNSLVFHSHDKVTSLFIHIMPCVTIHCLVHLIPESLQAARFQAIHTIKTALPSSPERYSLLAMIFWATVPYATWQLSYHFLITVRRREKIAAGRPTSFTWLRRSYAKTWIGKFMLSLPEPLQEPCFMLIQYTYALLTMLPAPLWFWSRLASSIFLLFVFTWSIHNGAVYYIDVFGVRFQKELEALKKDVAKWQLSPEIAAKSPFVSPTIMSKLDASAQMADLSLGAPAHDAQDASSKEHKRNSSIESIMLDSQEAGQERAVTSGVEKADMNGARERTMGML